jgi:hypothetical protein
LWNLLNNVVIHRHELNCVELCRSLLKSMSGHTETSARTRLAALGEKKPRSKAAQLRMLWPEIKAALGKGHTLKDVCECLEADGLNVSVRSLGSYVTRMRRKLAQGASLSPPAPTPDLIGTDNPGDGTNTKIDDQSPHPLANLRKSQGKRPAFDYRPELADPDKLI